MVEEISKTAARQGRRVPMTKRILVISTIAAFVVLALIYFVFWPWPEPGEDGLDDPEITQPERAPEGVPLTEPPANQAPPTQQ